MTTIEDRIDVLKDIRGEVEEVAPVLDRYQRALGTVVHNDLEWLDE